MARFLIEEFRLCLPFFPDELCGCEALEGLEPSGVVIGVDEQIKVSAQLVVNAKLKRLLADTMLDNCVQSP